MNSVNAITFSFQIFIFALGLLVTSIILARPIGPKGKGIHASVIHIPAVMLKLGNLGIEPANVYFTGYRQ